VVEDKNNFKYIIVRFKYSSVVISFFAAIPEPRALLWPIFSAIVGFLNFLNKNYDTNLDTSWVLDEKITEKSNMKKLEKQLLAIMKAPEENFNELEWIKLGLMYFHNLNKSFFNQMDSINYRGLNDGFEVRFGDQQYWIPKLLV
jgi:hypothetical protein